MDNKIRRLFRVPYERLENIKKEIDSKMYGGILHKLSKGHLLDRVEQANAAAESAIATFEIEIQHDGISPGLLAEFRQAHHTYYAESAKVRDRIIDRENTLLDFLLPISLVHSA